MRRRRNGKLSSQLGVSPSDAVPEYLNAAFRVLAPARVGMWEIIYSTLMRVMFAAVRWEGLTPVESAVIERELIMSGRVLAVRGKGGVYFGRYSSNDPACDFYGQPYAVTCVGYNGTSISAKAGSFVIGYDTNATSRIAAMIPPRYGLCAKLADRIYNAYAAWIVAMETSKAATIITTPDDNTTRTVKQVITRVTENDPYIVLTNESNIAMSDMQVLFRNHTDHVKVLYDNYINTWGMALDIMGMPNAAPNKHERMIVGEMELDQSLARYVSGDWMSARENFAKEVKRLLGEDIRPVNYLAEQIKEARDNGQSEREPGTMDGTEGD